MTTGCRSKARAALAKAAALVPFPSVGRQPVGLLAKIWMASQPMLRAISTAFTALECRGIWRPRRMALCSFLSCMELVFDGGTRQFIQAGQAKLLQKFGSGREERGSSNRLCPPDFHHQTMLDEAGKRAITIDATHGFDLRACDRLAIDDDGQRLQGGGRQPGCHGQSEQRGYIMRVLRRGHELHLRSQALQSYTALVAFQLACQRL